MVDAAFATPTKPGAASSATDNNASAQMQPPQAVAQDTVMANTEQFMPSTPFTPVAAPTLDQQAYMMMALAMSGAAGNAMSPPPTVTPSQVTLPNPMESSFNGLPPSNTLRQPGADKGLESFARVEFADSVFQMTTYAVIIGRDQRALEQARRDEKREEQHKRRVEENASKGLPPPSPMLNDRSKFSKSYVSEEGGMLGPESDSEESGRPNKRRKTSTNGSEQQEVDESQENIISNRQYVSHTPGAAAVDLASLRPSPWHVPFIGIHSPGPNIASKTKAISREHLKIAYNQEEGVFEAIPLHKNGFFCEDVHYKSDKVVLRCGDRLQIKDIDFRFMINGVERGRTGAEEPTEADKKPKKKQTHGGKEMSFEFEQAHGNGQLQDTSDELSELEGSAPELSDLGEGEDDEGESEIKAEGQTEIDPNMPQIPKKRGPGRPPKNGIMSKREQRLLKKQQQEMAKKTLPQAPPVEPPIKRKVGRPRKHPLPENANPEKRKYKPRKPKEDGAEGSDAERRAKEKKEKKARPKSPPLELKIEDYTEEQLQKPNKNYGVLIDETLTAAGPDGLTLKQIYKRICQRYPWFYFHTETKGWESSVRHNLIGNEAFKKDETTNLWSRVPGVELDAGKKRKASSPDRNLAAQGYGAYGYAYNAQHMAQAAPGYPPGQVPQGYQMQGYAGQPVQGAPRPVQQYAPQTVPAQATPGQQAPQGQLGQPAAAVAAQPTTAAQVPGYGPPPAPARPQVGASQQSAYSSPYASRPPPTNLPVKAEDGAAPGPAVPVAAAAVAAGHQAVPMAPPAGHKPIGAHAATPQPISARPAATPPAPAAAAAASVAATLRPVIDPRLLQAVVGLKNGLVENLKKARNPKAEAIVMSALNRCIGLKKDATENDKMEAICIKGIRQVIDGFTKNKSPTPGATTPGPNDAPPIFEAKVLASINGFKEVSIKALKARLGEAKAEAVTLSAIDRVLGFVDASIMPPPVEGETPGNFEGVEQHLMKSIRQLLQGMNQKVSGA
ncbi:Putative Forkhead domain-containing protein [[Torrubiella] hemipterigena]|uniref:Putative Forkhead domain-containing protein n=1 Tax=[Torrubiella] hemipterigena TaxID=1531966 RepID=A0A0A1TQ90_9HYPO|nr:Putative Forkhead domain-containing protein [[Torrubiella] hemipterigena]